MPNKIYSIWNDLNSTLHSYIHFSGGEWHARLNTAELIELKEADVVRVWANLYSGDDFMRLAMLSDALREVNRYARYELCLPYLPYARADRHFTPGDCLGLFAFGGLLSRLGRFGFDCVATLDVHSPAAGQHIPNLLNVSALPFIKRAIWSFAMRRDTREVTVLFPDKGARERYLVPEVVGPATEEVRVRAAHCNKMREVATGRIIDLDVPALPTEDVLVVDDICDGGATFLDLAAGLALPRECRGLYVTHGIFSRGITELAARYGAIYSTDSREEATVYSEVRTFQAAPVIAAALRTPIGEEKCK